MAAGAPLRAGFGALERWLEAERDQLPVWLPVALGAGIVAWFVLPDAGAWRGFVAAMAGVALAGGALARGSRAARAMALAGAMAMLGCLLIWWRAEQVSAPVLARPTIAAFSGRVVTVQALPARDIVRVLLMPIDAPELPRWVRVNIPLADVPAGLEAGATLSLRARLMPPAGAAVPGAYDFARVAWFQGIGATGRAFTPIVVTTRGDARGSDLQMQLSRHIQSRIEGSGGAIAAALATGDRGAIPEQDEEAMRRSGLAHLLSVSGLHVTAVVGGTMLLVLRVLALWPMLALRWPLRLIAAGAGAVAGIGYTLLTGAEVPTIRSCVAALLVLIAIGLGREAMTLRLVAAGALVVLLLWPEVLIGPSFQLSFAAVTAIVALHEHNAVRALLSRREESRVRALGRGLLSLLLTGVAVEIALAPIALFHFHQSGLYGALANIVAIPLTTFVIMPLEALALLFDTIGLGAPFWWLTARSLDLLLGLAHLAANLPGAVAALPAMPRGAFALMLGGGVTITLWRTRVRWLGLAPFAVGAIWAWATPPPDLLVTGDGRHVAIRTAYGELALLRDRAGDYVRSTLGENGGVLSEAGAISDLPGARCSVDLCILTRRARGRDWRIMATRSAYLVPIAELVRECRRADIVISERRLPRTCTPRWLKLDRDTLRQTGGITVSLQSGRVSTVNRPGERHPWLDPPRPQS